jgi:hypothetical protein
MIRYFAVFLMMRMVAVRLARKLRRSLVDDHAAWQISHGSIADTAVELTKLDQDRQVTVAILPSCCRLPFFERVQVRYGGTVVWIPLVANIRLRNAIRLYVLRKANRAITKALYI